MIIAESFFDSSSFTGTLPGRNPGIRMVRASSLNAWSKSGCSSVNGTSTLMRTLVGLNFSTVLFTALLLACLCLLRRVSTFRSG